MVQLVVNIIDHDFNVAEAAMCPRINQGSTQSIMIDGDRFLGAADTRRPDALALGVRWLRRSGPRSSGAPPPGNPALSIRLTLPCLEILQPGPALS
jgi:hypothetical protein